jgi:predicted peptidase
VGRETGFLERSASVNGVEHRYAVYVPREYDPAINWPAILFLHGYGESGSDGLLPLAVGLGEAIMRQRTAWPFVVVFPQKPEHKALWPNFPTLLDEVLRQTEDELSIDEDRRYLTGLSQGGHGTFTLARSLRWSFAAIAPICGFPDPSVVKDLRGMPVWAFHGERDPVVPPEKAVAVIEALQKAGSEARMTLYPDLDHNSWDRAYQDEKLAEWFLEHRRSADSNR